MKVELEIVLPILGLVIIITGALIKSMHAQAMVKLDSVVDAVNAMTTVTSVHSEKHEQTVKELARVNEHQKSQDEKIDNITVSIHSIKNKMVTHEQLRDMNGL